MYGVMLMANTDMLRNAPPEITSKNPKKALDEISFAITAWLMPGTGMCAPTRNTRNIIRVKNTFRLRSPNFHALATDSSI